MPYYLILKVFTNSKKLKSKKQIPFFRPFAKNSVFLLYIVFFHKLQKVYKIVYKNTQKYFLHFLIDFSLQNKIYLVYYKYLLQETKTIFRGEI